MTEEMITNAVETAEVQEVIPEAVNEVEGKDENPKKKRKPRAPKARKVEDLIEEATRKMSDKEKDLLISFLREDTTKLKITIDALKQNIEASYAKCREIEAQYEAMENFYKGSLKYIDDQLVAFAEAVRRSTVGGTN